MSDEIDVNKIATELVNQHIGSFYSKGKSLLKGATDKIRLHLDKSYKSYLACVTERYGRAKSFFIRDEPTYLHKFYVPLGVSCGDRIINKAATSDICSINSFVVIAGGAGSGKSMMMRHLFLDTILQGNKVPVFIELRDLNHTELSLLEVIQDALHSNHFELDEEFIKQALKAGHFIIFLDGFDEVTLSLRKNIGKQIQQLVKAYDKNAYFLSSRPDQEFSGWPFFSLFQITPLTLEQACELVQKLPYDSELKAKFLQELQQSLFEEHKSFLSNPLLLSIMLLTYGMSADIPSKLNVFYNQAYEALYQRHDALKGGYQRDRSSNLDIQDFARVFSAFSIQTYDKRMFQFSKSQALDVLEKSKKLLDLQFDTNAYLSDALQAVCLLVEDGLMINFSHRSFQEYFVAKFICDSKPEVQRKLIDRYSKNINADSVMWLLYEMKPEMVERNYIIPGIEKLERVIGVKRNVGISHYTRYIRAEYSDFSFHRGSHMGASNPKIYRFAVLIRFVLLNCGHIVGWIGFDKGENKIEDKYGLRDKIETKSLTYRDEFIQDLAAYGGFFSKRVLEVVIEIKNALIQKHRAVDNSLDEILGA